MSLDKNRKHEEFAKLSSPVVVHLIYSKPAFDIEANYALIQEVGNRILDQNMRYCKDKLKLPSFDPDNPYEDYDLKNLYFSAVNNLCQFSLWRVGLYPFAERYYKAMLETIKRFEKNHEYNHNKGIVYANLGISQAAQMKIDEGFANILKALDEDRGYLGKRPESEIFDNILFRQIERLIVVNSLDSQLDILREEGETCPKAYDFLKSLKDPDQRIFFEYTYAKIMKNYDVWQEKPNRFSANRMISYLQDMCLFAEDFLKRKNYSGMLHDLICDAFGVDLKGCSANSYDELNKKIERFCKITNKRNKALGILLTLRNFTSHNISAGEPEDFILNHFDIVFREVLRALIYIYQLN